MWQERPPFAGTFRFWKCSTGLLNIPVFIHKHPIENGSMGHSPLPEVNIHMDRNPHTPFCAFPSLLAMILSPTFSFPWPTSFGNTWFRPRNCLDNLPNDVFLDGVLHLLTVKDILSVRMTNKRFYVLTHDASIWKRLLRRLSLPVPPLPPTPRRSFTNLTGLEAERLFIRSLSLTKNFSSQSPTPYWGRAVEAFHHVQSMTILPGGVHLVASVREETRNSFAIMIFVLDYRNGGALPLAKTDTPTQAYNLQAKYMKLHNQNGIVIAYTIRDIRSKKYKMAAQG